MSSYKIAIAGTGYVGLSNAILLSQHNEVYAVDIIEAKVNLINSGKSPIVDREIQEYLATKDTPAGNTNEWRHPIPAVTNRSTRS